MPQPVVHTKLLLPRLPGRIVDRPRLLASLLQSADACLTVVSAPAGFGKTTLVGAWVHAEGRAHRTAWVSLDERDRDPATFWSYVLQAIDRAAPGTATAALALLDSAGGRVPVEPVLVGLLNELSVLPQDLTVVLDDYHLVDAAGVQAGMCLLVEHLPPQVHLVIITRADPALPLSRMRARGHLLEVRAADLRFTAEEAGEYLNTIHRLGLSDADLATLENRTEGWAAALQLAALSLRGRADQGDASRLIAGFAGTDRFVVDYLADEVLDRQPDATRAFLLDTSVLDQLSAPLCDAVTGRHDSRKMLAALERANLFVVPLDDHRGWYRYHHLFADVLQAHLRDERPGDVAALHRRASDWYDATGGDAERAVRHALACGDAERAAELVELAIPDLRRRRREAVVRRWIEDLPADVVTNRPVVAVGFIQALASGNEFDGLEQRLQDVEGRLVGEANTGKQIVLDAAEYARLPGAIATSRAALALVSGDRRDAVCHAERALNLAEPSDLITRASSSAVIGIASWAEGDLDTAHRCYRAAAADLGSAGHVADVLGCTITLADIEMTQGRLRQARHTLENALRLAARHDPPPAACTRGSADMYVGLSRVAWEHGDLDAAAEHLSQAERLGEAAGLPQNPYRWRVGLARLREAAGDLDGALALLEEAERLYVGDFAPDVRPIAADRAWLTALRGEVRGALDVLRRRGITVESDLSYRREYEHLALARILLAAHGTGEDHAALPQAIEALDRLLSATEAGRRVGTQIEVLVLLAGAHEAAGNRAKALAAMDHALGLAEPDCHVSAFTRNGPLVAGLLQHVGARRGGSPFAVGVLAAVRAGQSGDGAHRPDRPAPGLVDPLSDREIEVLRLLCSDLDGPAIARHLVVSLSTVRTHTQHIYAKFGVTSRRAAVRRAHQLNLFAPSSGG